MELPVDHFRLLGVSPSSETETILRALELRLNRFPDDGFTQETLIQRAELLRLSADLLSDKSLREKYEAALLAGASGLEVSSSREVAGLILLWEADAAQEAFLRACKALEPPQTPALGSGREADLTLLAYLSCEAAAKDEITQRHYEAAAGFLHEGIQILQRMGKLPEQRKLLQADLEALLPYRILDLLSRDLGKSSYRQEGLGLLEKFVRRRGGLEGKAITKDFDGLNQADFELFFQQIRKFLTVQEQVDLFINWYKEGSKDSGFLGVLALTAIGFSRRKPEKVQQARKTLERLDLEEIDCLPMLGCLDLLLGDIDLAKERFLTSSDKNLQNWLEAYPGEKLAALCDYCKDWLKSDVLPGFRDVDTSSVDLEAWFADRDVQAFVDQLDRESARGRAIGNAFSFLSSLTSAQSIERPHDEAEKSELIESNIQNNDESETEVPSQSTIYIKSKNKLNVLYSQIYQWNPIKQFASLNRNNGRKLLIFLLLIIAAASATYRGQLPSSLSRRTTQENIEEIESKETNRDLSTSLQVDVQPFPLKDEKPTKEQLMKLIEAWLKAKGNLLSGENRPIFKFIAKEQLITKLKEQRAKDLSLNQTQKIKAKITTLEIISRRPSRIEIKTTIDYQDQRLDSIGEIISQTILPRLTVRYILGKEEDLWLLHDYISGDQ